ncbi:hypothetical protein FQA47_017460 [Oryzias melastigma]|uniref:Uncharacterized protein n=1 Tax=Oryzias melastigma TaxID=30732 RepID=A0A834FFR6_ORYME|nr:hypothetical protein FQA47_017460 [Oryzias melastigma]
MKGNHKDHLHTCQPRVLHSTTIAWFHAQNSATPPSTSLTNWIFVLPLLGSSLALHLKTSSGSRPLHALATELQFQFTRHPTDK